MKITIDESKLVDDAQYCVISYMNVKYLQGLFERLGIEAEVFDIGYVAENREEFPDGTEPFWRMFYEKHSDDGNPEEFLTIIRSHVDSDYLRELLASEDVHHDYYGVWGKENPDEPLNCYSAWNAYTDAKWGPYTPPSEEEQKLMDELAKLLSE